MLNPILLTAICAVVSFFIGAIPFGLILGRVFNHTDIRKAGSGNIGTTNAFRAMGKPRYGVLIGGGNLDSMVAHYTVAKRRRTRDLYSEGGQMGKRPDRPTIVYANRAREAFPDTPIVIGGLEASLRRFAHYD